jgi:hypothetical protein
VISYSFLWSEEAEQGQVEGRKDRPCAIVIALEEPGAKPKRVAVVPITHSPPRDPAAAVEIPQRVKSHLGLDSERSWVIKHPDRAEATRAWNFPFAAIEEAVVNAVYHRSYEEREPIEVRISHDELVVVSFPGPARICDPAAKPPAGACACGGYPRSYPASWGTPCAACW